MAIWWTRAAVEPALRRPFILNVSAQSSVLWQRVETRPRPCQGRGRGFESLRPLQDLADFTMVGKLPWGNIWGNSVSANVNSVGRYSGYISSSLIQSLWVIRNGFAVGQKRERFRYRRLIDMNRTRNALLRVRSRNVLSRKVPVNWAFCACDNLAVTPSTVPHSGVG